MLDNNDIKSMQDNIDTCLDALEVLGVSRDVTLHSFTTYGTGNPLGEKKASFADSTIKGIVLSFTRHEEIASQGLLTGDDLRVILTSTVKETDQLTIDGKRYRVIDLQKYPIGSMIIYALHVRCVE